jgi:hypothetical protein
MERAVVVRGHLSDSRHVDLDEPVSDIRGAVEVTLRPIQRLAAASPVAVLNALGALPDLRAGDVGELERMIEEGKMPMRSEGVFDHEGA